MHKIAWVRVGRCVGGQCGGSGVLRGPSRMSMKARPGEEGWKTVRGDKRPRVRWEKAGVCLAFGTEYFCICGSQCGVDVLCCGR